MKKVAWVANAGSATGVGHYADALRPHLAREGARTGFSVDAFHLDGEWGTLLHEDTVVRQVRVLPGILRHKTFNWLRLGRHVKAQLRQGNFSLVHLTNQTLSFLATTNIPTVVTVHDIIELVHAQSQGSALAARLLYRHLDRAAYVVCVSQHTARQVQERLGVAPDKITVVYNGVDAAFHPLTQYAETVGYATLRRELKLAPDDEVVLYVGSEHPRKNVPVALAAFAECRQEFPHLVFVKVGEPGLPSGRAETLRVIEELRLRERVRFVPAVSRARLNEFYNLARIFVFPSSLEGFGLPPLQAMAAGTPVVAANTSSMPEVLGDAALLVDPSRSDAVADAMRTTLKNDHIVQRLRVQGLARAATFSWEKAAQQIRQVYQHVWE